MQKHNRKSGLLPTFIALLFLGSFAAAQAEDPALAKTVFYVQ
jgi:hypothetical protein